MFSRRTSLNTDLAVDGMDNKVQLAHAGWPDRRYMIGRDGRIAFKGPCGPAGFRPPLLEAAIEKELGLRKP